MFSSIHPLLMTPKPGSPTHFSKRVSPHIFNLLHYDSTWIWLALITSTHYSKRYHLISYTVSRRRGSLHSVLKVWFEHQWHWQKCRISGPIPDLLNHDLHFNENFTSFCYTVNLRSTKEDYMNLGVWQFSVCFPGLWLIGLETRRKLLNLLWISVSPSIK